MACIHPCVVTLRKIKRPSGLPLSPLSPGGARRDRTVDLYNAIVALSQLSYGPETCAGGRRYKSDLAAWQPQRLAVALALVVLDFDLDLVGLVGEVVGVLQRLVVSLQVHRLFVDVLHLLALGEG